MTLKELSIELGKPVHVLANILRQVNLADRLLDEEAILTAVQIERLKNGKVGQQPNKEQKSQHTAFEDAASKPYSIASLAKKYNRPVGEMVNNVKMSRLMGETKLSPETVLPNDVWKEMEIKLNDKRIRLRVLANELGLDPEELAQFLLEKGLIDNKNWNQKLDKSVEDAIRNYQFDLEESEEERELRELHEYLDEEEYKQWAFAYEDSEEDYEDDDISGEDDDDESIEYEYWDAYNEDEDKEEDIEETNSSANGAHTVASLAAILDFSEERVMNILKLYSDTPVTYESRIADEISEHILSEHQMMTREDHKESFDRIYLQRINEAWNNPIYSSETLYYTPGQEIEGEITSIDESTRKIYVIFKKTTREGGLFSFITNPFVRPEKKGVLTFDEWDWELSDDHRILPKVGEKAKFLILSNNGVYNSPLTLSRRQLMLPPAPTNGYGVVVAHHPEEELICVRDRNGAYGFITYTNLSCSKEFPILSPGTRINISKLETHTEYIHGKAFHYAEYDIANEDFITKRTKYLRAQMGLSDFNVRKSEKYRLWLNTDDPEAMLVKGTILPAKVINTNSGGYLLELPYNEEYELFCPYGEGPTRINRTVHKSLIGKFWLVKIETPPTNGSLNMVVSAKIDDPIYEDLWVENGFYEALICSCSDKGTYILVENLIPMFMPNKYISYGRNNDAERDLKLGQKCIVKIIRTDKGVIASIRDSMIDPWAAVRMKLPCNTVVQAEVIKREEGYIRVTIGEYIGHIKASEISWNDPYIKDCNDVELPDPLRVVIKGYHEKTRTVQVSIRDLTPDPWPLIEKYLPEDRIVTATITDISKGGAWLRVDKYGFKGYLSFRNVDWCRYVDKSNFPYPVGSKLDVKVIQIKKDKRLLTCSLKALKQNPWELLEGEESVRGTVLEVNDEFAKIRIVDEIECFCREALDPDSVGKELEFRILQLNVAAQQIIISYRKKEIEGLNTLAVGEMFKEYRYLEEEEKQLIPLSPDEDREVVFRDFKIKEISSTGRVTAEYAQNDGEYKKGILLPGSITIGKDPVNIIFARQIIKKYLRTDEIYSFRVTHRYEAFNCAVLSLDVTDLLDLNHISTDDMKSLTSNKGVSGTVLSDISTERNVFIEWKGYFGYIPRTEIPVNDDELPEKLQVKAIVVSPHPEQMIRFVPVDIKEQHETEEEQEMEQNLAEKLDDELYDCYQTINSLDGFNPDQPDYYPFALQMRFDPEKQSDLGELLESDPTFFSSQTFFLDCIKVKKGYLITVFNNYKSITAFSSDGDEGNDIRITKFIPNLMDSSEKIGHFRRPLRIAGENIQIVPLNSSALSPDYQDMDILMALLQYNREVLPELHRLSSGDLQKRGEHYLTLQDLLRMDLDREIKLCSSVITIQPSDISEKDGILGGCGIEFEALDSAFDSIISKDDSDDGIQILIKPNDEEKFNDKIPSGKLKYMGANHWRVDLYADRNIEIEDLKKYGIQIKRYPNIRHLKLQIRAIDNFVYERNGLDIFSKIARKKLKTIDYSHVEDIEANRFFNLDDPTDSQANALKMALGGSEISLIQGPPGTGKSTVIVDVIRNLVKRHKKVLVCTQSVAPVEELYYKISGRKDGKQLSDPVKVNGHSLRCAYLRDDKSLEISGRVNERYNALKDVRILTDYLFRINSSSDEQLISKFKDAKAAVEQHHKQECGEIVRKFNSDLLPHYEGVENVLSEYIRALEREDIENFSSEAKTLNLESVDVVFGTCIGVGVSPHLRDLHFDTLIIDEAGKANYAESLLPMMMANEYILVGDDKQLPPYTNSELVQELAQKRLLSAQESAEESDMEGLTIEEEIADIMEDVGKSLFGDLKPRLPETNQIMLSKQYRMHPEIGDFVSKLFYDGKVSSVPKPSDRSLNIAGLEAPIKFIDTSGMGSEAREHRQGMSLYNDGEIQVIDEKLRSILHDAINTGKSVGILSPYGAQVMKMRQKFPELKDHIFTIDSIQGEEYDVVVFSFVRNTRSGSLNFVDNLRRLNVSFSRAKCNLIMVGHLDTLKNETLHKVDRDAVVAVYDEIQKKKIELVAHHGAMQMLYDDFPPESCPVVNDLDHPYHVFEGCRLSHGGQFTGFYKGKLLTMFNPTLKNLSKEDMPKDFRVAFLGYRDGKPWTMVEPMGRWLCSEHTLKECRFSAVVNASSQNELQLELPDKSIISLQVPNATRFSVGAKIRVSVRNNKFIEIRLQ